MSDVPSILDVVRVQMSFQRWATDRIFAAAREVEPGALAQPHALSGGMEDGSLFATLAHIASTEEHWLNRWLGDRDSKVDGAAAYADLDDIHRRWEANNRRGQSWLGTLTNARLAEAFVFNRLDGTPDRQVLWLTTVHVANHSTHHRSEACVALTLLGHAPEPVDMIGFIRAGNPGV